MKTESIYWDSCVFISHLGGDGDKYPNRQASIDSVVAIVDRGGHKLLTSTLSYVEVLDSKMSPKSIDMFDTFMKNRNKITALAVNLEIAKKAQSIRNKTSITIKTPDAIHIATAIIGKAVVFHTFDKKLLNMSERKEVDGLIITQGDIPRIPGTVFGN